MNDNLPSLFKDEIIHEENKTIHRRSYIPSAFITASLPVRDVNAPTFHRKFNNIELFLTGSPKVPYGKYARLLLSIITTKAVLSKTDGSVIVEYKNIKSLTDEMLLPKQRGKDIKQQLELFSLSTFQYKEKIVKRISKSLIEEYDNDEGNFLATWNSHGNIPFMKKLSWVDLEDENSPGRITDSVGFTIELSSEFVELCKNHSVPIDYTVYSQISSALGKDLFAWLTYRNNCLEEGSELFIPRFSIVQQFASNSDEISSKEESQIYLNIVEKIREIKQKYYPELNVFFEYNNSGFTLRKSPPLIKSNDTRYILITNNIIN